MIPNLFGHKIFNANNSCLNGDEKESKFVGNENMINQEDNENINEILKEKMKEINNMNQ